MTDADRSGAWWAIRYLAVFTLIGYLVLVLGPYLVGYEAHAIWRRLVSGWNW